MESRGIQYALFGIPRGRKSRQCFTNYIPLVQNNFFFFLPFDSKDRDDN